MPTCLHVDLQVINMHKASIHVQDQVAGTAYLIPLRQAGESKEAREIGGMSQTLGDQMPRVHW